jgi:large subunit ribosomal protein L10
VQRPAHRRAKAETTNVDRAQKQKLVDDLHGALSDTACVVVTHQSGLTVAEVTGLRRRMRDAGASFKVTKNRLARLALQGTKFEHLSPMFTGPTAIAFSRDPVAAAKVAVEFANSNDKLTIVGGALGGQSLNAEGVKALASMPSLDELRAKLIGLLQTPATRIATVLQAPASQLARVLSAYAKKGEAA